MFDLETAQKFLDVGRSHSEVLAVFCYYLVEVECLPKGRITLYVVKIGFECGLCTD